MSPIKDNVYLLNAILLSLFATLIAEVPVTGRCGRPALPPKASKWLIPAEKSRFDNKERVIFVCKKNEFVHHKQQVQCRNGRWIGQQPRCGQFHRGSGMKCISQSGEEVIFKVKI